MSARRLPERPNLDQLKHQAKELLAVWRSGASSDVPSPETPPRFHPTAHKPRGGGPGLRDAQRAIAQQYGFDSWDLLRAHVDAISGSSHRTPRKLKEVLDYDDPVPGVVELNEPLTAGVVQRLIEQGISEGILSNDATLVAQGNLSAMAQALGKVELTTPEPESTAAPQVAEGRRPANRSQANRTNGKTQQPSVARRSANEANVRRR